MCHLFDVGNLHRFVPHNPFPKKGELDRDFIV